MPGLIILLLALLIDLGCGELPTMLHPVGWMGKLASLLENLASHYQPKARFLYGTMLVLLIMLLFVLPAHFLLLYLKEASFIAWVIVAALLLKTTFSIRGLHEAALKIKGFLTRDNLEEARYHMRSLVSRNTKGLDKPCIVAATVESVAENASDSFIAPLFFFLLFGVPGAIAYRVSNTLDAMIGYHGEYEYLGKFAARLDDLLNFLPSRIAGLLIVVAAFLAREDGGRSWQIMLRDHGKTESPNAGWPMSAMAGALNVQLEKLGHYKLGDAEHLLVPETVDASLKLMWIEIALWTLIVLAIKGVGIVLAS